MSSKNRVEVKILGQEYKLVSDDSREYMQSLANYVDDRMLEIAESNKKLSTAMTAVLTALNIGDDYFKLKMENDTLKKRMTNPMFDMDNTKQKLVNFNTELEKRNKEYEVMIAKVEELLESSSVYEEELEALKEKLNILSYELDTKEKRIIESDYTIKNLESQIIDIKRGKRDSITITDED
ncbi:MULTISPECIES: cell division protein ZapA [unclassified Fusibacter]|uniref:cell division protein ZapA n=1 Tax=unclassified Fusibacter TaxID=2624464 RepID=UPI001012E4D7|nr:MULTISPECIES: cell division protein ZapA [unclassified Fusibacter]MCK8058711.1 cell division protein ZapA [Fusibacter sp. A2]NPE21785.1 cell division protein ZapA [Fusibacter sp. A1]RXV61358.1 cell division protein ZapA [Fusibacter sp. A1]